MDELNTIDKRSERKFGRDSKITNRAVMLLFVKMGLCFFGAMKIVCVFKSVNLFLYKRKQKDGKKK